MTDHAVDTPDPESTSRLAWLDTNLDGLPIRVWIIIGLLMTVAAIAFGAWWTYGWDHESRADSSTVAAAVASTP